MMKSFLNLLSICHWVFLSFHHLHKMFYSTHSWCGLKGDNSCPDTDSVCSICHWCSTYQDHPWNKIWKRHWIQYQVTHACQTCQGCYTNLSLNSNNYFSLLWYTCIYLSIWLVFYTALSLLTDLPTYGQTGTSMDCSMTGKQTILATPKIWLSSSSLQNIYVHWLINS